jgi:hypothetical protein
VRWSAISSPRVDITAAWAKLDQAEVASIGAGRMQQGADQRIDASRKEQSHE